MNRTDSLKEILVTDFGAHSGAQIGELNKSLLRNKWSVVNRRRDNPPLLDRHQRTRNVLSQQNRDISGLANIRGV